MKTAQIATPNQFFSGGPGRRLMENGFDPKCLRTNALLRKDEWKQTDDAAIETARQKLAVVKRMQERGLVHNLGSLGVLISEWERIGDFTEAEQSMSSISAGEFDTVDYDLKAVPVPLTFKDFYLEMRRLAASRMRGESLDTTGAALAGAVVAEKLEDTVINGSKVVASGYTAYGLLTHPDRTTGSVTAAWATASTTGAQILADTLAMISDAEAGNHYGPFELFVGTAINAHLRDDFKAASDLTIRDRLLQIDALEEITVSAKIPAGAVVLVQMTKNVLDLAVAQDIITVEWAERGGMVEQFRVFAAMVARIKSDKAGNSGIVHYT